MGTAIDRQSAGRPRVITRLDLDHDILRNDDGSNGCADRAYGRDDGPDDLRVENRATGRQRICRGPGGGRDDDPIREDLVEECFIQEDVKPRH